MECLSGQTDTIIAICAAIASRIGATIRLRVLGGLAALAEICPKDRFARSALVSQMKRQTIG
jgi:hypothetical protein